VKVGHLNSDGLAPASIEGAGSFGHILAAEEGQRKTPRRTEGVRWSGKRDLKFARR
jgi:isopentenyl phosphate kinase